MKKNSSRNTILISAAAGLAAGVILTAAAIVTIMPSMMIQTHPSRLDFNQTVSTLKKNIIDSGWVISTVSDMNRSMARHNVEFGPRVKLIKLCKPEYAKSILETDRYISTMMPCTFSVWEDKGGQVYLSKINMGLMARMFGGNIARIMGGKVAKEEHKMLSGIIME